MIEHSEIRVAVIEDNRGDFFLIEEYLIEVFDRPDVWQYETFRHAQNNLFTSEPFDVILLDLSLPDAEGEELVNDILKFAGDIPVIVLTGYSDKDFGLKTLSMGVSDYLLKDELDAEQLKRSILYSTERKRVHNKLKESEKQLKKLSLVASRTTDVVIITEPDQKITWVNQAFKDLTGYTIDEVVGRTPGELLHGDDTDPNTIQRIHDAIGKKESIEEVILNYAKDGRKYWLEMNIDPIFNEKGECTHFIAIERDVTKRKEEEEKLKLLESVITNTSEAVVILEAKPTDLPQRKIIYVNDAFAEMTGYCSKEAIGRTLYFLNGPKTDKKEREKLNKKMDKWQPASAEFINYKKNGEEFWVNWSMVPVKDKNGNYTHWISIGRDVSLRRSHEENIHKSLKEKDILLAEVHHRVKNNLAVISAMLQLQAAQEDDENLAGHLFDSIVRIKAIANIHEHLYQSQSFSELNFSENIKELVNKITETFERHTKVNIQFDCDDVSLNVNQAIPCSLIINEVITNSLKHAFIGIVDANKATIIIELKNQGDTINLAIKDNGVGIPEDILNKKVDQSLGLQIIAVLSQQLKADYSYNKNNPDAAGTHFHLSFKKANIKGTGTSHLQKSDMF